MMVFKTAMRCTCILAAASCVASVSTHAETTMRAPQLVKGGQMLLVGFEADPSAIRAMLPAKLEPLGNMVLMNMYTVADGAATSGLGAYTLTYLTLLVKGYDGYAAGQKDGLPGRYVVFYWNSSNEMRTFTRAAGWPDDAGGSTQSSDAGDRVQTTLLVNGSPAITASADLAGEWTVPSGGQSNYLREVPGKGLTLYPVPWVCSARQATNPTVKFSFPDKHPAARLAPTKVAWAARVNCDIAYPQGLPLESR